MTEVEIRRAMNIVAFAVDSEPTEAGVVLGLNKLRMPEGRSMTLHAGGHLKLTDVVQVDIAQAHNSPQEQLATMETRAGDTHVVTLRDIYALGLNHV